MCPFIYPKGSSSSMQENLEVKEKQTKVVNRAVLPYKWQLKINVSKIKDGFYYCLGGCTDRRIFFIFSMSLVRKSASAVFWANMSKSSSTFNVSKLFCLCSFSFSSVNSFTLGSNELADTLLSERLYKTSY